MSAVPRPHGELFITPMRPEQVDAVAEAEAQIYPFPWTRGNFVDSFNAGHSLWICRNDTGELVGYAVVMLVLDEAHLLNISIVPALQRQGLGRRLLGHLFEVAKSHGATRMFLEVRPSNAGGQALYRGSGFAVIGQRRSYYPSLAGREDAIVMARDL